MKERPILFNGEMVRAILDGRKTQTRRLVKPQPHEGSKLWGMIQHDGEPRALFWCEGQPSNYGTPLPMHVGDRLWVRETFSTMDRNPSSGEGVAYRADGESLVWEPWTPSIHMPRWASRIDLEITRVWVERVQDITEENAKKEGIQSVEVGDFYGWKNYQFKTAHPRHGSIITDEEHRIHAYQSPVVSFKSLWQSIYGTWDANPWVWVYEFRRIKP